MWLRLRQICLVADHLAPAEKELTDTLGIAACFRDPGVGIFGLENVLMPVGDQLLEVVAPTEDNTAAGRYLERRGGNGGYMVITQCDDHARARARVDRLGIRIVHQFETPEFRNLQMHPRDTGGCLFEIDQPLGPGAHDPDGPWEPAGPDWRAARRLDRVTAITAAEIQADDPAAVAARWAEIAEIGVSADGAGNPVLHLDNAEVRFVPCTDGRPEGLGGLDLATADAPAVLAAAEARGAVTGERQVTLCGMRLNLVDPRPETR